MTDTTPPWDVIHYEKVQDIPPGTRSVLCKYRWNALRRPGSAVCSLYGVRMEADYRPPDAGFRPLEVTFTWKERQADYSLVTRSHTQLVEKLPSTYTINVGGADHPVDGIVDGQPQAADRGRRQARGKYGYSDGKDVGGAKFADRWVTYGKNLAEGKPYTCTVPSETGWGAGDPGGKILTDGIVGSPYVGGNAYQFGALWKQGQKPLVTVDLGKVETCGVFCIQTGGYPFWDALKAKCRTRSRS